MKVISKFLIVLLLLIFNCKSGDKVNQSDQLFNLAQNFAKGEDNASQIKELFDAASEAEINELLSKKDHDRDFIMLMILGKASEPSNAVIAKIIANQKDNDINSIVVAKKLIKILNNKNNFNERYEKELIVSIIKKYPECINDIILLSQFNVALFVKLITNFDKDLAKNIYTKLKSANLKSFLVYSINHDQGLAFKTWYQNLDNNAQEVLRSLLLTEVLDKPSALLNIISQSEWGLKYNILKDTYILPSLLPATQIKGPLLYIMAARAIMEDSQKVSTKPHDFTTFTSIATTILNNLVDDDEKKAYLVKENIWSLFSKALGKEPFIGYYFNLANPSDMMKAISSNDLSNIDLLELYDKIIIDHDKAIALAKIKDSDSYSFIHKLFKRKIDSFSRKLALNFIKAIGDDEAQRLLADNTNTVNKNPWQLLLNNSESNNNDEDKDNIITVLLSKADTTIVNQLSDDDISNQVQRFFMLKDNNKALFKDFYIKLDSNQQKIARSKLLSTILSHNEEEGFIIDIVSNEDVYGLKAGINDDIYLVNSFADGSLFYIIVQKILQEGRDKPQLAKILSLSQMLKPILGIDYDPHLHKDFAGTNIKQYVANELRSKGMYHFAGYYLASPKEEDVYAAAAMTSIKDDMVYQLFSLIIKNDAQALTLANIFINNKGFIHHLAARTMDKSIYNMMMTYLHKLPLDKQQEELLKGVVKPLKIILAKDRSKVDKEDIKLSLVKILANNIDNKDAVDSLLTDDIIKNKTIILDNPEIFKNIYTYYSDKEALRNLLLEHSYNQGAKTMLSLLNNLSSYGLKNNLSTDIYKLKNNPAHDPDITGSLINVLASRAAGDIKQGNNKALTNLRSYALLLKQELDSDYAVDINPFKNLLSDALKPMANAYVAIETLMDLLTAASEDYNIFTNIKLKELYALMIKNHDQAYDLSQKQDSSNHKFIHLLLKRPIDEHMYYILDKLLSSLYAKGEEAGYLGASYELAQLNDDSSGIYPLVIVADATRSNDDITYKAKVLDRLVKYSDDVSINSLTLDMLRSAKLFRDFGQNAFSKIYDTIKTDPIKAKAWRTALLKDALLADKANDFVNSIDEDNYHLKSGIKDDKYDYDSLVDKNISYILFYHALARPNRLASLRAQSLIIHKILGDDYDTYITPIKPDIDALLTAKAIKHDKGYIEYYLDHDNIIDVDFMFEAIATQNDASILSWLYEHSVKDAAKAQNLASKIDSKGQNFLHLLLAKNISKTLFDIGDKFLSWLSDIEINHMMRPDNEGKYPLAILLDNRRKDKANKDLGVMTRLVVDKANDTIKNIVDENQAINLLKYLNQDEAKERIAKAFNELPAISLDGLAKWSAENVDKRIGALFLKRYDEEPDDGAKDNMLNKLISTAYVLGYDQSTFNGASKALARLIDDGYFSEAALMMQSVNPFNKRSSSLLYALLDELRPNTKEQITELITSYKSKMSADDWRSLLDNNLGIDPKSIIELVTPWAKSENEAKVWLKY